MKPGGQLLFFEANYWNPQVFVKTIVPPIGRLAGNARCQVGMRKYDLMREASHQGFTHVQVIPYDIIHALTPRFLINWLRAIAFVLEHTPFVREFCGTLYIWAKKPGDEQERRPQVSLDFHRELFGSVSVVVPCHNEEMNVRPLVNALLKTYDRYILEILLVNDNSNDGTASAIRALSAEDPRVRLIDRKPPNGVGRALREGYAAARGRYILTMDCDFVQIIPEFRDLFAAVMEGYDGAIGSRFSHESVLINYPLPKILANRGFHLLLNLLLGLRVRDVSNNLKLMRSDVLKGIDIEENHFAANVETGLKADRRGVRDQGSTNFVDQSDGGDGNIFIPVVTRRATVRNDTLPNRLESLAEPFGKAGGTSSVPRKPNRLRLEEPEARQNEIVSR